MRFALLLLLWPSVALAEVALGMAPLGRGLTLWIGGEKTIVGFGMDHFQLSWNEEIMPDEIREYAKPWDTPWEPVDHLTRHIGYSLTVKRLLSTDEVAPFIYGRFYVELIHEEWEYYYHDNGANAGPELGWGARWRPLKRTAVFLRQGWAWEEKDRTTKDGYFNHGYDGRTDTAVRMQETLLLVLIYF